MALKRAAEEENDLHADSCCFENGFLETKVLQSWPDDGRVDAAILVHLHQMLCPKYILRESDGFFNI